MLYLPGGGVHAPELDDLAYRLQRGDGVQWAGDPSLWVGLGVIENPRTGKVRGRRIEVWRHCEDGEQRLVGSWLPHEVGQIPHDVAVMSAGARGRIEDAETRIDKANEAKQDEVDRAIRDELAQKVERLAYDLVRKQGHARTSFQVPSLPES